MIAGFEMWLWSFLSVLIFRLLRRMVRNAKIDLVEEVLIIASEAMKQWEVPRERLSELVIAAYEGKADSIAALRPSNSLPAAGGASAPSGAGPAPADRPAGPAPALPPAPACDPGSPGAGTGQAPIQGPKPGSGA